MINEISPHIYDNSFHPREPQPNDIAVCFRGRQVLTAAGPDGCTLPRMEQVNGWRSWVHLFEIDGRAFFLLEGEWEENPGLQWQETECFRTMQPMWMAFGGVTAWQLQRWRKNHRFCGRCGTAMEDSTIERALCCPKCGNIEYPKIAPAVIVAIKNGDKLLMARNRRSTYKRYGLIAGFVEIGETFEDTVHREVMEEVGLRVKNVQYFRSQPWAFADNVMIAFTADVDGSDQIHMQEEELSEVAWFTAEQIPVEENPISVGGEMIQRFRAGKL
ncbi:MAG: NAD(+) diphosphatase [Eubacteriales bacterium]|jgi:NAD+ diphosphatase